MRSIHRRRIGIVVLVMLLALLATGCPPPLGTDGSNDTSPADDPESAGDPETVATPAFSLASGSYAGAQSVSVTTTTSGATIFYTVNGDTPTSSSTEYTGTEITVTASSTLKAFAVKDGMTSSTVAEANYTISSLALLATPDTISGAVGGGFETGALTVTAASGFDGSEATIAAPAATTELTVYLSEVDPGDPAFDPRTTADGGDLASSITQSLSESGTTLYFVALLGEISDTSADLAFELSGTVAGTDPAVETVTVGVSPMAATFTQGIGSGSTATFIADGTVTAVTSSALSRSSIVRYVNGSVYVGGAVSSDNANWDPAFWENGAETVLEFTGVTDSEVSRIAVEDDGTVHALISNNDDMGFAYWVEDAGYMDPASPSPHVEPGAGIVNVMVVGVQNVGSQIYQLGLQFDGTGNPTGFALWIDGVLQSEGLAYQHDPLGDPNMETAGFFIDESTNTVYVYGEYDTSGTGSGPYEIGYQPGVTGDTTDTWIPVHSTTVSGSRSGFLSPDDYWYLDDGDLTIVFDGAPLALESPVYKPGFTGALNTGQTLAIEKSGDHAYVAGVYSVSDSADPPSSSEEFVVWRDGAVIYQYDFGGGYTPWEGKLDIVP